MLNGFSIVARKYNSEGQCSKKLWHKCVEVYTAV